MHLPAYLPLFLPVLAAAHDLHVLLRAAAGAV